MEVGIDLSEYYINVEWDILRVPAERHVKVYACCPEPYPGKESVQCSIWVNVRDLEILCNTIEYLTCMHSPNNAHSLTLFNSLFILFTTFKNHQPYQGHVYNAPILSLVKRRVTE